MPSNGMPTLLLPLFLRQSRKLVLAAPRPSIFRCAATMSARASSSTRGIQAALDALQSMYAEQLGARLKAAEDAADAPPVPAASPFVVRVDGVSFATFTGGLVKPFDRRLKHAMVAATIDLATKFQPVLAYHHSDEISLVFLAAQPPPTDTYGNDAVPSAVAPQEHSASAVTKAPKRIKPDADMKTHTYAGRVQKLASVVAAYASVRFNYHLSRHDWSDRDEKVRARMTGHEAYFDGRVVPVPDVTTAMDCIFWRSNFDGFRNSVSGIAQHHFKHTQLQNKNLPQLLDMLAGLNINVMDTYGPKYLFGTWVKKESYFVKAKDLDLPPEALKRLAPDSLVSRRRVRTGSFNWADYSAEERTKFLAAKFWPDDERAPPKDDLPEAEK